MSDKKDEKSVETVKVDDVVVVERAPRLQGGVAVKSRITAGKKSAAGT